MTVQEGQTKTLKPTLTFTLSETPLNLTAAAVSSSQINLRWQDQSNFETEFRIEQKAGTGGNWIHIANRLGVPDIGNIIEFSDAGLNANTTYYYRVRACNNNTEHCSSYSNEAGVPTM